MEYEITQEENKIIVLFKENELFDSFNENTYSNMMLEIADENKDIVLDFQNVDAIDSLFIGGMIMLLKKLQAKNKKLIIINMNSYLQDIFKKMNMENIINQQ